MEQKIGKHPKPLHWFAADDLARMVSTPYHKTETANKRLFVHGPEALTMKQALERFAIDGGRWRLCERRRCGTINTAALRNASRWQTSRDSWGQVKRPTTPPTTMKKENRKGYTVLPILN